MILSSLFTSHHVISAAQYNITYSIWADANARTEDPQYVKIKGKKGETNENLCDENFNVIDQDVACVFISDINIGDYECVSLRTAGSDGLDLIKVKENLFYAGFLMNL